MGGVSMLLHRRVSMFSSSAAIAARRPRVLVVGGGPVGLTMGFLLEKLYDVRTRIVERQLQPTTHPQAHFLNLRTMEVLHATMPAFHDKLLQQAAPSQQWRDYIYCTGVGKARELARVDQFGPCIPRPSVGQKSPDHEELNVLRQLSSTQFLHFPQNQFEAMLSEFLQENGLQVERGVELVNLQVDASGVNRPKATLRNTVAQTTEEASYDFVIGADGAHSLVRQLCGIDMVGALNLQSIVNVHFTSKALSQAAQENPAMLYFIFNQHVIGVLIAHDLKHGEWVFQIPFFPPQESIDRDFSVQKCRELIHHVLPNSQQLPKDDIKILSVGQWRMSARVAKQYDLHRQVFLVGDAVHQFPPAGGFGMNTGIQDAHNLAWKVAMAIENQPNKSFTAQYDQHQLDIDALLRSYGKERQHIAKINTQLSLRNYERTMKIPNALNVSHHNAKLLSKMVNSAPIKLFPLEMQREFLKNVMKVGKMPLGLLETNHSTLGERMRSQVKDIVERRSSLGMLFYHFDIGFSYQTGEWEERAKQLMQDSALDQSALFNTTIASSKAEGGGISADVFCPEFRVGMRFPHFWCQDRERQSRISTLELHRMVMKQQQTVGNHRNALFLLIVDDRHASFIQEILDANPLPLLKHVALIVLNSTENHIESGPERVFASMHLYRIATDNSEGHDTWNEFLARHSAALVRPDGHISFLWSKTNPPKTVDNVVQAMQHSVQLH